ncbi:hypothetical protein CLOM_g11829 [Closterium sp. NIES-68]|nr:hypothetical protein CLOM_g11829 [Closterium sp. NIES-68]GJP84564.1 hypothetical protein CLOP_g14623 [Closterium sp. NIES-67]
MARRESSFPSESNKSSLEPPQLSGRPLSKHGRDSRPQFLRAARPFTQTAGSQRIMQKSLAESDHSQKSRSIDQGTCVDPLPLHATELNLRQPPSAALSAIEWIILRAQGLPVALDELDLAWSYSQKRVAPPRSPAAYLSVFERELRREAIRVEMQQLESMVRPQCSLDERRQLLEAAQEGSATTVYPRCNWPRQGTVLGSAPAAVETAAVALAMLTVTEAASPGAFARCGWPRTVAAVAGARCDWPRRASAAQTAFIAHADSPAMAARCAWPRSSPAASTGPRCAWPRPTALSALPGLSPAPSAATTGAHCAWPHKSSAMAEGPRCMWPRAASQPLAAAASPSPRCSWPRTATAVVSAETAPAEGARCAWPRQLTSSDVQALLVRTVFQAEAIAPQSAEGPRCAWPRASSTAPAPPPAVTEGPRCAWPHAAPAIAAPTPAETPLGPRCAWPRQTEAMQQSAAAEELHGDMLPQIAREEGKLETAGRIFERRRVRGITLGA